MNDSVNISQLTKKYNLGTLTLDEQGMLNSILESSEEACKLFTEEVQIYQSLEAFRFSQEKDSLKQLQHKINKQKKINGSFAVLGLISIVAGFFLYSTLSKQESPHETIAMEKPTTTSSIVLEEKPLVDTHNIVEKHIYENVKTNHRTVIEPSWSKAVIPTFKDSTDSIFITPNATITTEKVQEPPKDLDKKDENIEVDSSIDPCSNFGDNIKIRTEPSIYEQESGAIFIDNLDDNVTIKVNNEDLGQVENIENMAPGTHYLTISNSNDCSIVKPIRISETKCITEYDDRFNISISSEWEIPAASEEHELSIISKYGEEVYSSFENEGYWNGLNKNSEIVAEGYYKVFIKYADNETCIYDLTVFQ